MVATIEEDETAVDEVILRMTADAMTRQLQRKPKNRPTEIPDSKDFVVSHATFSV